MDKHQRSYSIYSKQSIEQLYVKVKFPREVPTTKEKTATLCVFLVLLSSAILAFTLKQIGIVANTVRMRVCLLLQLYVLYLLFLRLAGYREYFKLIDKLRINRTLWLETFMQSSKEIMAAVLSWCLLLFAIIELPLQDQDVPLIRLLDAPWQLLLEKALKLHLLYRGLEVLRKLVATWIEMNYRGVLYMRELSNEASEFIKVVETALGAQEEGISWFEREEVKGLLETLRCAHGTKELEQSFWDLAETIQFEDPAELAKAVDNDRIPLIIEQTIIRKERLESEKNLFHSLHLVSAMVRWTLVGIWSFPVAGLDPKGTLLPIGVALAPTLAALMLMLGQYVSQVISCMIFIFGTRPFDAGDAILVNGSIWFRVKQPNVIATTMENTNGIETYYPNALLASENIVNMKHATAQIQTVELLLPPSPQINALELELEQLVVDNPKLFKQVTLVRAKESRDGPNLRVLVLMQHKDNFNNFRAFFRRQKVLECILQALQRLQLTPRTLTKTYEF